MTSLEALEKLKDIPIYDDNGNQCSDLGNCCDYNGDLIEVYNDEINCIENDLEMLKVLKDLIICDPMTLKAIFVSYNYNDYREVCMDMACIAVRQNVYNKIKEWLYE